MAHMGKALYSPSECEEWRCVRQENRKWCSIFSEGKHSMNGSDVWNLSQLLYGEENTRTRLSRLQTRAWNRRVIEGLHVTRYRNSWDLRSLFGEDLEDEENAWPTCARPYIMRPRPVRRTETMRLRFEIGGLRLDINILPDVIAICIAGAILCEIPEKTSEARPEARIQPQQPQVQPEPHPRWVPIHNGYLGPVLDERWD
ncbi:hypothetical protein QAD02_024231 [Eretmocerus hayati]|uniref:Uncharacterized protein n=2 Tax=Eretmocerus hayati TaxID=131215 RepID=A0ACC2PBH5_9HYME|nr:hypothetical protein QAD02_016752 [Eretmocerus hayati]KAJ8688436.1 hypothetical protein QAD02_024231 [Eretmocerus hayati]